MTISANRCLWEEEFGGLGKKLRDPKGKALRMFLGLSLYSVTNLSLLQFKSGKMSLTVLHNMKKNLYVFHRN